MTFQDTKIKIQNKSMELFTWHFPFIILQFIQSSIIVLVFDWIFFYTNQWKILLSKQNQTNFGNWIENKCWKDLDSIVSTITLSKVDNIFVDFIFKLKCWEFGTLEINWNENM